MKDFWESCYGNDEYIYGKTPNLFFKNAIDQMEPGKLFLPGEGEGRNAVYAAEHDWDVDHDFLKCSHPWADSGTTFCSFVIRLRPLPFSWVYPMK